MTANLSIQSIFMTTLAEKRERWYWIGTAVNSGRRAVAFESLQEIPQVSLFPCRPLQ